MGRHRTAVDSTTPSDPPGPRARRNVAVTAAGVVTAGAGTYGALGSGPLSSGKCARGAVGLRVVAASDIAPALTVIARGARTDGVKSDGNRLAVTVTVAPAPTSPPNSAAAPRVRTTRCGVPDSLLWTDQVAAAVGGVRSAPRRASRRHRWSWASCTRRPNASAGRAGRTPGRPDHLRGEGGVRLGTADPTRGVTGLLAPAMINRGGVRPFRQGDRRRRLHCDRPGGHPYRAAQGSGGRAVTAPYGIRPRTGPAPGPETRAGSGAGPGARPGPRAGGDLRRRTGSLRAATRGPARLTASARGSAASSPRAPAAGRGRGRGSGGRSPTASGHRWCAVGTAPG